MKIRLTKTAVDALTYTGKVKDITWDADLIGFGVRAYPSGKKSFLIGYRHRRTFRTMIIGNYGQMTVDQARKVARDKLASIRFGQDPMAERRERIHAKTMSFLCDEYLTRHAKRKKKSCRDDIRRVNKTIKPAFGRYAITDIDRGMVSRLHDGLADKPFEANLVLALLSKMFNLGELWGYTTTPYGAPPFKNPCRGIQKFKTRPRDRFVRPDEMPRLMEAVEQLDNVYVQAAIWLYLLTGFRVSEVLRLRWEHVDLNARQFYLPDTKAGRSHWLHISEPCAHLLKRIPRQVGNPYVLPGRHGNGHLVNIAKPWAEVRKLSGLKDLQIRDLRRTFGSWLAQDGASLHLVGTLLNHSNERTTKIYARFAEKRGVAEIERHAEKLVELGGGKMGKLIRLPSDRGQDQKSSAAT